MPHSVRLDAKCKTRKGQKASSVAAAAAREDALLLGTWWGQYRLKGQINDNMAPLCYKVW